MKRMRRLKLVLGSFALALPVAWLLFNSSTISAVGPVEDAWNLEYVGRAVTSNGQDDPGAYSKLAPWPDSDGRYLYSGCYNASPLDPGPGRDRCFLTVDLIAPEKPLRLATVHSYDVDTSPSPPLDHVVWSDTYSFPALPVQVPCMVNWDDPGIKAGTTKPACWDPGWNTHTHYVSLGPNKVLAVNQERFRNGTTKQANYHGVKFYDVSDPAKPVYLSYWAAPVSDPDSTGEWVDARGSHHFNFDGPYLYLGSEYEGYVGRVFVILDVRDPRNPVEASHWGIPGQKTPEEDAVRDWVQSPSFSSPIVNQNGKWTKHVGMHYATVYGNRAYLAYNQAGLVIMDIEDKRNPKFLSRLDYLVPTFDDPMNPDKDACVKAAGQPAACGNTHSAKMVPGKEVLWLTDEYFTCPYGHLRMIDISDDTAPRIISHFAYPENTACDPNQPDRTVDPTRYLRRGPSSHIGNTLGDSLLFLAWYGMGVRVIDISDVEKPVAAGHYSYVIDRGKFAGNDTYDVTFGPEGYLYASDGTSGLRVLRYTGPGGEAAQ